MLENGYIKLHRSLSGWRWYKDGNVLRLWIHLLITANYEPKPFADRIVGKGELVTSLKSLSEQTGMTVKEVRTALDKLKRTGEIAVWSNRHYTVVTIQKYSLYQTDDGRPSADQGQTKGKPTANQGQTKGNQRATMEERKESKKARKQEESGAHARELSERFSGELLSAVQDWLRYKAERKEGYTETGCKAMLTEIENNAKRYGDAAVADLIRFCMARQWRGIIWDRIKAAPQDNGGGLNTWEQEWLDEIRKRTNGAPGEES